MRFFSRKKPDTTVINVHQTDPGNAGLMELINQFLPGGTSSFRDRIGGSGLGASEDNSRQYYDIFKYPFNPTYQDFYNRYSRQDIANRIVNDPARRSWRDMPLIEGREDDIAALKAAKAFEGLERADTLNRIGNFSVLYVGVPDGLTPAQPVGRASGGLQDCFFAAYPQDRVQIAETDDDPASPRYGLPLYYTLTASARRGQDQEKGRASIRAHWTRCVHMSEGALEGTVQGISALQPVLNRLIDLEKTMGGGAEGFYRVGSGPWTFEVDPQNAGAADNEKLRKQLNDDAEKFTNGWTRFMYLFGIKASPANVQVPDGKSSVETSLWAISGATGIPLRVLTGQGGGQTTGHEDRASYNDIIRDRQLGFCASALRDLWRVLSDAGLLDPLQLTDQITYPPFESTNENSEADAMEKRARALFTAGRALADDSGMSDLIDKEAAVEFVLGRGVQGVTGGDD